LATRAVETPVDDTALVQAPERGQIDSIIDRVERLPVSPLLWIIGLFAAWAVLLNAGLWLAGVLPVGSIDLDVLFAPMIGAYAVGLLIVLDGVAGSALRDFAPALGDAPAGRRLARDLRTTPDLQVILVVVALEVVITGSYVADPVSRPLLLTRPPAGIAVSLLAYWTAIASMSVLVLRSLRQLWLVSRLHAAADNIDLFNSTANNALSRLTAATAVGIIIFAVPFVIALPNAPRQGSIVSLVTGLIFIALGAAIFVLPLRGMHHRLVVQQRRLLIASAERLKTTIARVHETVETNDMARADELQKTLTSLLSERDVVSRLSTWPWSAGTFRGFASAIVLPVLIWLLIRVLERVV
jgi:hypothetical protein